MPTLVLTPRFTEDSQALWRAAGRLGWAVERLPSWRVPEHLRGVPDPVLYVEVVFAPMLAETFGLQLVEPPEDWLPSLPREYRQRDVRLTTAGEFRRSGGAAAFVKPPNDKSFPAGVYAPHELPSHVPDETPVLVQETVQWEKEFRCYVLDRELRTFSIYLRDGQLQRENEFRSDDVEDAELISFVGPLLADDRVALPKAAVIDVGVIRGRGWAVVEQNAVWGAGIYGCDPEQVLHVLRHAAEPLRE
jgi:hypothetical protein